MSIVAIIAKDLGLDENYISKIISRSSCYYRDYFIPKKNGERRPIAQAGPELKTLQYWVVENILRKLPISQAAVAYNKGSSIKANALVHTQSKHILHLDVEKFFPSITSIMLKNILRSHKEIIEDLNVELETTIETISKICFRDGRLCIGTVSSPIISNIVMYDFDQKMLSFCKANKYKYSRYADDMYVSSNNYINEDVVEYVSGELKNVGFRLNKAKTRFYSSKYRRKVTGLVITTDSKASIGTARRNEIKKMVYNKLIHNTGNSEQILGYLSFLKDIEPDTYNNIIVKYSRYCQGDIIKALTNH